MKVNDEPNWLAFKAELARDEDPEVAHNFLSILEEWATLAEREYEPRVAYDSHDLGLWPPIQCLRHTLATVEQNHGTLSGMWIFEMLVLLDAYWIHGERLYELLSTFEQRSFGDVARAVIRASQEGAEAAGNAPSG